VPHALGIDHLLVVTPSVKTRRSFGHVEDAHATVVLVAPVEQHAVADRRHATLKTAVGVTVLCIKNLPIGQLHGAATRGVRQGSTISRKNCLQARRRCPQAAAARLMTIAPALGNLALRSASAPHIGPGLGRQRGPPATADDQLRRSRKLDTKRPKVGKHPDQHDEQQQAMRDQRWPSVKYLAFIAAPLRHGSGGC